MPTDCPFCRHERATLHAPAEKLRSGGTREVYRCDECGCYYPRPRHDLSQALRQIHAVQDELVNDNEQEFGDPCAPLAPQGLVWRLKRLLAPVAWPLDVRYHLPRHLKPGGDALDVGAGPGRFCHILGQLGYNAIGVEPLEQLAGWARSRGVEVYPGHFPDAVPDEIKDRKFDLIACMESLFYFSDISRSLKMIHATLRHDGHLLVKALNSHSTYFDTITDGFAARYGDNAQAYPNLASLRYWLERSGFEIINIRGGMWSGPEPAADSSRLGLAISDVTSRLKAIELFGRPLYDLDKTESLLVLARKIPSQ